MQTTVELMADVATAALLLLTFGPVALVLVASVGDALTADKQDKARLIVGEVTT